MAGEEEDVVERVRVKPQSTSPLIEEEDPRQEESWYL